MFADLQRRYFWIQPTLSYRTKTELVGHVDDALVARAEKAARHIEDRRATARGLVALRTFPRTD